MKKRLGKQTICLKDPVSISSFAAVGGSMEKQGPLSNYFDALSTDHLWGQRSWEQAESEMQQQALALALQKAGLQAKDLDCLFAGDLLNQCTASAFSAEKNKIPFYGLYGACSTMGEAISLSALLIDGGFVQNAAALTSSHFNAAERQYRMPMPYGSQRTPTAQWTATASGCCILSGKDMPPYITHLAIGKVQDLGITDPSNMGAAMAPAAHDTLSVFFRESGMQPGDFDLILTGDLGYMGHHIVRDWFSEEGNPLGSRYTDCGLLLYDREKQDMHCGASGCGCSASVLCSYLLPGVRDGRWNRILFAPTGALLSPTSSFQGQSIPGICHAVVISHSCEV